MRPMRSVLILAAAIMLWISSSSEAAELIMVRQVGCPWCAAWERDIGPIYSKSEAGQRAPLRTVDLRDRLPVLLKGPIVYTPTFVLVEKGREIGRIEGYTSDHFFWDILDALLLQLPAEASLYMPRRTTNEVSETDP